MTHHIESIAYAGDPPWHGLGRRVHPKLTPAQMQVEAELDWTVRKIPLKYYYGGKLIKTDECALIRKSDDKTKNGTYLSTVSAAWEPVQNTEMMEFFHDFVKAGHMEMHTAGSLRNGKIVWALARIKNSGFYCFGGDEIDSYMLMSSPHVYGKGVTIQFTPIRVVCWNTLVLSLSKSEHTVVTLDHRAKFDSEKVMALLSVAENKLNIYKSRAETLGNRQYTDDRVKKYLSEVFPFTTGNRLNREMSRPAVSAYAALETQPGAEFAPGSWWSAFNAVTFNLDHVEGHSTDTRITSAWYGKARGQKLFALEKALEYANA
jgi:phage/plasmid-like protein (TIGR03299 family)